MSKRNNPASEDVRADPLAFVGLHSSVEARSQFPQHTWALALPRGTMNQAKAPISLTLPQCSAHLRLRSGSRWAGMRGVRSASMVRRREEETRTWFAGIWRDFQPALSKRKPQERQPWRCSYNRGGWRCTSSQSKSLSFPWIRAVDKTLVLPVQGSPPGWRKGRNA